MAKDYGGQAAYGTQARQGGRPGSGARPELGGQPGFAGPTEPGGRRRHGRSTRAGRAAPAAMLLLGIVGLGVSVAGVAMQILPRQFTAYQQRQIRDWETGARWRDWPAGRIYPASVRYPAPSALGYTSLMLTATRIGIARQASCRAATDAAAAAVLRRNGCEAVLRATYADGTDSYVVTVGIAAFAAAAQASAAHAELADSSPAAGAVAPGVRTVPFAHSPAAWFTDSRRQVSGNASAGTYLVFYTIGYADDRPRQLVATDGYAYSEMLSFGTGVAQAVLSKLAGPVPPPRCPGTPGC